MITNTKIGYGGRLGNQMFQYAMLLGIGSKTGYEVRLPQSNEKVTIDQGCYDLEHKYWIPYRMYLNDAFDTNIQWMDKPATKYHKEKFFHYDDSVFIAEDGTDFDGYFQSYKYFYHIMDAIRKEFSFKKIYKEKALKQYSKMSEGYDSIVAIHVRRGDYLGIPNILPVCEPEYYQRALESFGNENYRFAVFSDDIPWCKEAFGEDDSIYYSMNDQYTDLCLMTMCNHFVISNSTYSLWAALLCDDPDKKVIAPQRWFGSEMQHNDTKDMMPPDWVRM